MTTINGKDITTGDYLVLRFGNGTQGVKVVGTTEKRLEIIRCQQYLSENPFWTGTISKVSRSDDRIQGEWRPSSRIAAAAPSDEEVAEWKDTAKHQAACSKFANKAAKKTRDGWLAVSDLNANLLNRAVSEAHKAAVAEWCEENGRDKYGRKGKPVS